MKRIVLPGLLAALSLTTLAAAPKDADGWVRLFDGKTLNGWKASEAVESWSVDDGALVAHGKRSHLFYVGDQKPFVNFELKADVWTEPGSNGGIYIHTQYQDSGWPRHGYEIQVNNTHKDPIKTGSLYGVTNVMNISPAQDRQWFTEHIIVQGNRIIVKVDGKTVVDFTEESGRKAGKDFTRKLSQGTFGLQGHDPNSIVRYKNILVKRLD